MNCIVQVKVDAVNGIAVFDKDMNMIQESGKASKGQVSCVVGLSRHKCGIKTAPSLPIRQPHKIPFTGYGAKWPKNSDALTLETKLKGDSKLFELAVMLSRGNEQILLGIASLKFICAVLETEIDIPIHLIGSNKAIAISKNAKTRVESKFLRKGDVKDSFFQSNPFSMDGGIKTVSFEGGDNGRKYAFNHGAFISLKCSCLPSQKVDLFRFQSIIKEKATTPRPANISNTVALSPSMATASHYHNVNQKALEHSMNRELPTPTTLPQTSGNVHDFLQMQDPFKAATKGKNEIPFAQVADFQDERAKNCGVNPFANGFFSGDPKNRPLWINQCVGGLSAFRPTLMCTEPLPEETDAIPLNIVLDMQDNPLNSLVKNPSTEVDWASSKGVQREIIEKRTVKKTSDGETTTVASSYSEESNASQSSDEDSVESQSSDDDSVESQSSVDDSVESQSSDENSVGSESSEESSWKNKKRSSRRKNKKSAMKSKKLVDETSQISLDASQISYDSSSEVELLPKTFTSKKKAKKRKDKRSGRSKRSLIRHMSLFDSYPVAAAAQNLSGGISDDDDDVCSEAETEHKKNLSRSMSDDEDVCSEAETEQKQNLSGDASFSDCISYSDDDSVSDSDIGSYSGIGDIRSHIAA